MKDRSPAVSTLGLRCLTALCTADALDFYKAWCLVHAWLPAPPPHPAPAAAWVRLLACGAFDAAAHPDKATAIVQLLWAATGHGDARVRGEFCFFFHGYSFFPQYCARTRLQQ